MNEKEKKFTLNWGGKDIQISFPNFAERANGEAMVRYGDTVVYATATMSKEDVERDFFPLSVSYEEKFYAAGKISGSRYTRREGKPSDRATLISRMIDRAIRPKFSKEMKREVQVIITCLSWDEENDPGVLGMIASSVALYTSDIPWNGPLGAVRIGKDNDFIVNPNYEKRIEGSSDIVISGFKDEEGEIIINMIEGVFKEENDNNVLETFKIAAEKITEMCDFQDNIKNTVSKEKISIPKKESREDLIKIIKEKTSNSLEDAFKQQNKIEESIEKIKEEAHIYIVENYEEESDIKAALFVLDETIKEKVRRSILEKEIRIDGRKIDELRKISCTVGVLPRTHGSALFERGQTKALSIITLGAPGEEQLTDAMELAEKKRFMHHYNFPPSSVGEVGPLRGPGRREIGHGMLAENAVLPLLPESDSFPYIIRGVSEIVCSNGSTSMASVCGTTLALMDAGVPIKRPVAGISIGLVSESKNNYKLLTDIQGLEDHYGDMDFKVAGTEEGVTAIQMDVKVPGITLKMIKEALEQAKKTRLDIIGKIKEIIPEPRKELSPYAPRIVTIKIHPDKIGELIGPKGKIINDIIEKTNVAINIEDDGTVSIVSEKEERIKKALIMIENITKELEAGQIFDGKVIKLLSFGAVIEVSPGKEGLLHISEISNKRIDKIEDVLSVGQIIKVKVIKVEDNGKTSFSIKQIESK